MQSKISLGINTFAFLCSAALVGIGIATIYLTSDAYDYFTNFFPPGSYGWMPSHYIDDRSGFSIRIGYDRSSEIKTYIAATVTTIFGLLGTFAFGTSFKRPAEPAFSKCLIAAASIACVVATVGIVWSAVAEVNIKHNTCWFEPAKAGHQYWCSTENAACNTLRFADETQGHGDSLRERRNYQVLDNACLQFRHARYLIIPLAVISFVLAGLYAAQMWFNKKTKVEDHSADEVEALIDVE